jgi:nucleoside-diphosphate-sugar epimerase
MKYAVSGSKGFIGGNLCVNLLKEGHDVRAIPRDYLHSYYELKYFLEEFKPDVIIHFAAYGNHSQQKGLEKIVDANIGATINLLQASKGVDYKAFINTSTSSVELKRQTFYSATKRGAEEICKAFSQEYNKPIVSIRPFSVYGPGEANFRFIPTVIRSAKYNGSFQLAPKPKHDWIYIQDFIDGIKAIIPETHKLMGKSIRIGTGTEYSNQEVVDIIESIHGSKLTYEITDKLRNYDCESWVADNTALKHLGWEQNHSLVQGLKETYEYY